VQNHYQTEQRITVISHHI